MTDAEGVVFTARILSGGKISLGKNVLEVLDLKPGDLVHGIVKGKIVRQSEVRETANE